MPLWSWVALSHSQFHQLSVNVSLHLGNTKTALLDCMFHGCLKDTIYGWSGWLFSSVFPKWWHRYIGVLPHDGSRWHVLRGLISTNEKLPFYLLVRISECFMLSSVMPLNDSLIIVQYICVTPIPMDTFENGIVEAPVNSPIPIICCSLFNTVKIYQHCARRFTMSATYLRDAFLVCNLYITH